MMLLWNHDTSAPLASTRNGSLSLREDARGLFVEATLPDTNLGRDIAELVRSGTIDAMSFGFKVQKDSWNDAGNVRTLEDVSVFEISLVSYPAYESTAGTVAVRNYVAVADKTEIDATVLADAMNNFEAGNTLSTDQVEAITTVLSKLAPAVEEEKPNADLLALKKKKFDLLVKDLHIN
jgi:HK97 family phage prohead protease